MCFLSTFCDFSELCQFYCSAGVLPAWSVYTHWHRGKTEKGKSPKYLKIFQKNTIFHELPVPYFWSTTQRVYAEYTISKNQDDVTDERENLDTTQVQAETGFSVGCWGAKFLTTPPGVDRGVGKLCAFSPVFGAPGKKAPHTVFKKAPQLVFALFCRYAKLHFFQIHSW